MKCLRLLPVILVLVTACVVDSPAAATPSRTPADRLTDLLIRSSRSLLQTTFVDVEAIDTALAVLTLALDLRPDDPQVHRLIVRLASMRELDDRRIEALEALSRIDPSDEVSRLALLGARIDQLPTAEARSREYRRLLADPSAIGEAVASRLALEAAMMEQRRGHESAFATWLAEAAALDPSNGAAAAIAAGYFRMHVNDPVEEAELLLQLFTADPAQVATASMLGRLLVEHGAMTGASRMFGYVAKSYQANHRLVPTDLVADQAISGWGLGRQEDMLRMIRDVRRRMNDVVRESASERLGYQPTPEERSQMVASLGGALETVEAALLRQMNHARADEAVAQALSILRSERLQRAGLVSPEGGDASGGSDAARPTLPRERMALAAAILEEAWVAVWLSRNAAEALPLLEEAADLHAFVPAVEARFRGWAAFRAGRYEEALAMLEPIASEDPLAMLGVAHVMKATGRDRDAARAFLSSARERPGSLVGVWSQGELMKMLGTRAPISDTARRLEALMSTLPAMYDRLPLVPSQLIDLRLVPVQMTLEPGDPLDLVIEIRNNGSVPIAIDRQGPIRPQVVIEIESAFSRRGLRREGVPSVVVDIDRHLRIPPRGKISIPVRMEQYPAGIAFEQSMAPGGAVRLTATLNPAVVAMAAGVPGEEPAFRPGALGGRFVTQTIRKIGIDLTLVEAERLMEGIGDDADEDTRAVSTALAVQLLSVVVEDSLDSAQRAAVERLFTRTFAMFRSLSPEAQAWIMGVIPTQYLPQRLHELARSTDSRLVRASYILAHVSSINDPFVATALESSDPVVRRLGELFVANYYRVEQRIRERDRMEGLLPSR